MSVSFYDALTQRVDKLESKLDRKLDMILAAVRLEGTRAKDGANPPQAGKGGQRKRC